MSNPLAPTTRMPSIGDGPLPRRGGRTSSGSGVRVKWRGFRRSVYSAVRSSGAWFLALTVGVFTASVSWVGWLMTQLSEAAVASAEVGGRGIQESLPQENEGLWLSLAQVHSGWFMAVPFGVWFLVVVFKEVK